MIPVIPVIRRRMLPKRKSHKEEALVLRGTGVLRKTTRVIHGLMIFSADIGWMRYGVHVWSQVS